MQTGALVGVCASKVLLSQNGPWLGRAYFRNQLLIIILIILVVLVILISCDGLKLAPVHCFVCFLQQNFVESASWTSPNLLTPEFTVAQTASPTVPYTASVTIAPATTKRRYVELRLRTKWYAVPSALEGFRL